MKTSTHIHFHVAEIFVLVIISAAAADVIYVDQDAVGLNNGTSWANAFTTLQPALTAAGTDDEVWVAEGTYVPTVEHGGTGQAYRSFQLKNYVAVYGGFDPTVGADTMAERDWQLYVTILIGQQAGTDCYHVFYHPYTLNLNMHAILDGFTVSGGNASGSGMPDGTGGGMYNDECSPTILNCIFTGNSASSSGGAVYNVNFAEAYFEDCLFENNHADAGGAVENFWECKAMYNRCIFQRNSSHTHGGAMIDYENSSSFLRDCVFIFNVVSDTNGKGGAIYCGWDCTPDIINGLFYYNMGYNGGAVHLLSGSNANLVNCTIADNLAYNAGGAFYNDNSEPVVTNSIIYFNRPDELEDLGATAVLNYCDVRGDYPGKNFDADPHFKRRPVFIDRTTGGGSTTSFIVADGSVYAVGDAIELNNDSQKRIIESKKTNTITFSPATSTITTAGMLVGNWGPDSFGSTVIENYKVFSDSACIDSGYNSVPLLPSMDLIGMPRVLDGDHNGSAIVDIGAYELNNNIIFVDRDAEGANNGNSWTDAYVDLQDGLDDAFSGNEIWVAEGAYPPSNRVIITDLRSAAFRLKNGVEIYGGFDPGIGATTWARRDWANNETILSGDVGMMGVTGDNAYHVIYDPATAALNRTAVLDGFMITLARTDDGIAPPHDAGGGMYNNGCSPTIANCTFTDNVADQRGGAVANYNASPLFQNCTFTVNDAVEGGAIYNSGGAPEFLSCSIGIRYSGAYNTALFGGGVCNDTTTASLTSCMIADNRVSCNGGGVYNRGGTPVITNCTFFGNQVLGTVDYGRGGAIYCENSNAVITDSVMGQCVAMYYGGGIYCDATSAPTLTRCTIDTCHTQAGAGTGGGVYCDGASPVFESCVISNNWVIGDYGGGIYCSPGAAPVIRNSTIEDNRADADGAGIYCDHASPILTDCVIRRNEATLKAGGMASYNYSNPTVTGCTFSQNNVIIFGGWGAGVNSAFYSTGTFTDCVFELNTADYGGGFTAEQYSDPVLVSCTFTQNTSAADGGGLMCYDQSDPTVANCLFHHNTSLGEYGERTGGAVFVALDCNPSLINCTITENTSDGNAGGIGGFNATAAITSCIVWGNTPGQIVNGMLGDPFSVNYCDVEGGFAGTNNINADPLFVEALASNYRLQSTSPCIDRGKNATVPAWLTEDKDGLPRKVDGDCDTHIQVDIGAYEFSYSYFGSFDRDCDVDLVDFSILSQAWMTENGDALWNRICDISDPADDVIDLIDLQVFAENWLTVF